VSTFRVVTEIAIGAVYAAGAVFNTTYTLRHTSEFYKTFADRAWLRPTASLVRTVIIPNGTLFTVLLIAFQVTIAIAIFTRGDLVTAALHAGGAFAFVVAFFSSPGGTIANLMLATVQFGLATAR
jgi:hypothetical protein